MDTTNISHTGGVNRTHHKSLPQKLIFAGLHFTILLVCVWLLYFQGYEAIGNLFGAKWGLPNKERGTVLLACAALYWVRHLVTLFYLLVRRIEWSEVFGLLAFMALFEIGFILIGAGGFIQTPAPFVPLDYFGLILLIIGSGLNSGSEIQRKLWKRAPATKGHCYTKGLFRYSMHINYFGDVVLFTGWALLTTCYLALGLPILMAYMFITIHIPGLDAYLAKRYGDEFTEYANKTKKLIPFIY